VSISLATERLSTCVISLSYDRADAGADERAVLCHRTLSEQLQARGYPPYRLTVASMAAMDEGPAHADLLRTLKAAMDPNGVLAPGRYEPAARPAADERAQGVA
jgi:4-cresol dehydrogenase (hydroxylating)